MLFSLPCVGVDIGSFGVKIVHIRGKKLYYYTEKFKIIPPPKKVIIDAITNGLSAIDYEEKERYIATTLKGKDVKSHYAEFPLMRYSELMNILNSEIEKYLLIKREEAIFDAQILKKEKRQMSVLIVGAKKFIVEERISLIKEIGWEPYLITTETFALTEAYKKSKIFSKTSTVALLDVGYSLSKLIIVEKGLPLFERNIEIGDALFISSLCERFNIDEEKAQELKYSSFQSSKEVELILQRKLKPLCEEIQLSFDYYEYSFKKAPTSLYISGGGASFPFLKEFLSQYLNINIYEWDMLETFNVKPSYQERLLFNIAIGLALSKV
ncbi:MAG: hypothetical protein DRP76_03985 [Candidatus Omnitrophota bacterium]|nr:MAG: hypothetical protein DRP76_03985 [Candidatus Omnitrophota bacterium]